MPASLHLLALELKLFGRYHMVFNGLQKHSIARVDGVNLPFTFPNCAGVCLGFTKLNNLSNDICFQIH